MASRVAALICLASFAGHPQASANRATTGSVKPLSTSELQRRPKVGQPSKQDAGVLLSLMQIFFSDPVLKARRFWRTELSDGMSLSEFESRFPKGSEGYEQFINLASFWETVGALMQRGLVSEDLAFDTFLDAPPWHKAARIFKDRRERDKQPLEGVNFEWIAARAEAWISRHEMELQRKGKQ